MARRWHRQVFDGVAVPVSYFVGGIRDSDPTEPELVDYEVAVQGAVAVTAAVSAANVWAELRAFEASLRAQVTAMDADHPYTGPGAPSGSTDGVVELAAWVHGEWIRIHPFVNGNGRIARVWANWVALRYGLPPFVRLRPRPAGNTYVSAAERSMAGDHRYMEVEFLRLLALYLSSGGTA
jgi:fido (protein-threonine AMPylation protein)